MGREGKTEDKGDVCERWNIFGEQVKKRGEESMPGIKAE